MVDGGGECAGGPEDEAGDAEGGGEVVGPAEEEVGEDGGGGRRVGFEPVEEGSFECAVTAGVGDNSGK